MKRGHAAKPIADRFWPKVQKTDTCWLWTGAKKSSGYGQLMIRPNTHPTSAHRVAWELTHGPIPDGLWVLHRCDVPACVRPDHLFLGTRSDNMRDCFAKGRWRKSHCHTFCRRGHAMTPENTWWNPAHTFRQCRACNALRRAQRTR